MLRKSGLTRMEQGQVLGTAGAAWDANGIETALTMMYSDAHHDDRSRLRNLDGGQSSLGSRSVRSLSSASTTASR